MRCKTENYSFVKTCFIALIFSTTVTTMSLLVHFLMPAAPVTQVSSQEVALEDTKVEPEFSDDFQAYLSEASYAELNDNSDKGLVLYRQSISKNQVEWFYTHITGNKDIALAIITEADKNDIPLSLAFALAYTESRFKTTAINKNSNATIDRGLFQLNSNSFPALTEAEFFDPFVSAKYGMSHLRFCLNTAGNEVSALAMYNAGTTRVRSNRTPQVTLNYVGKIMSYRQMLDTLFEQEVVAYYEAQLIPSMTVAKR